MEYEELKQKLNQYEIEFDQDNNQSLKKMIDLYIDLFNTNYHDLADSIELWVSQYGNDEVKNYIQQKNDKRLNSLIELIS